MGLFTAGLVTGVMACAVVMLVRCAAWYELKHPEDDYWHRSIWRSEAGAAKTEQRTVKPDTERQNSVEQVSRNAEVTDEEGH